MQQSRRFAGGFARWGRCPPRSGGKSLRTARTGSRDHAQSHHAPTVIGGSEVGGNLQRPLNSVQCPRHLGRHAVLHHASRSRTPPIDAEGRSHPVDSPATTSIGMPVPKAAPAGSVHPRLRMRRASSRSRVRWRSSRPTCQRPSARPDHRARRVHDHEVLELRGALRDGRRPGDDCPPSRTAVRPRDVGG